MRWAEQRPQEFDRVTHWHYGDYWINYFKLPSQCALALDFVANTVLGNLGNIYENYILFFKEKKKQQKNSTILYS